MGTMASFAGMAIQAGGQVGGGIAARRSADAEAGQYSAAAGQVRAASQRQMQEELRKSQRLQSRALAVGAASGGGTGGNVMDTISDLAGEGVYRALLTRYDGESRAAALEAKGDAARREGRSRQTAGMIGAFTTVLRNRSTKNTILTSGTSLFEKYAHGGFDYEELI